MASLTTVERPEGFGETTRTDTWWAGPLATFLGLIAFVIYANIATFQGTHFEIRKDPSGNVDWEHGNIVAPYLTPFYSPLLFDARSPHAWFSQAAPSWWPSWFPFSAALLILPFPLLFRFTCYYYRKAYYRAFFADPPGCAVGEPKRSYTGESRFPFILQNLHRYALYLAIIFILFLWKDALSAFFFDGKFGVGVGTLVLLVNVILLSIYTLSCHSLRHLAGGRLDCFSCSNFNKGRHAAWKGFSVINERHMLFAWLSLFSVGFADFYVRLVSSGAIQDVRLF